MSLLALAFNNLRRNLLRSALTITGVAVAIIAFVLLRTVIWAWTVQVQDATMERIVTRHKVTFVMALPKRYVEDIRAVPGVKNATWANWFGGKDPNHEHDFFAAFAVDASSYFEVYDEMQLPPEQLANWKANRKGLIVGPVLAKKFGWKVGDTVILQSQIFPGDYEFKVEGIYTATRKSVDNSTVLFQWDYLNDSLPERAKDEIGWVTSRVSDPTTVMATSQKIDRMFDERDTQTLSQDEHTFSKSFMGMFSAVFQAIEIVSLVILGIMMLILGNTVAMGVRERVSEHAVLRAIGFLPSHIAFLVVVESGSLGLLGGGLGLLLAYPLVNLGVGRFVEENMSQLGFPYFRVTPAVGGLAFALAIGLAALAAALPAWGASRMRVVDALRRVM